MIKQVTVHNIPDNSFVEISPQTFVQVEFISPSETLKDGLGRPLWKLWFSEGGYCYMPGEKVLNVKEAPYVPPRTLHEALQSREDRQ
jgi:hypothetical protein